MGGLSFVRLRSPRPSFLFVVWHFFVFPAIRHRHITCQSSKKQREETSGPSNLPFDFTRHRSTSNIVRICQEKPSRITSLSSHHKRRFLRVFFVRPRNNLTLLQKSLIHPPVQKVKFDIPIYLPIETKTKPSHGRRAVTRRSVPAAPPAEAAAAAAAVTSSRWRRPRRTRRRRRSSRWRRRQPARRQYSRRPWPWSWSLRSH